MAHGSFRWRWRWWTHGFSNARGIRKDGRERCARPNNLMSVNRRSIHPAPNLHFWRMATCRNASLFEMPHKKCLHYMVIMVRNMHRRCASLWANIIFNSAGEIFRVNLERLSRHSLMDANAKESFETKLSHIDTFSSFRNSMHSIPRVGPQCSSSKHRSSKQ